ncbi:integrase catalytic domain-containing protein [Trichonephila clavipes]|nr:integrase catalytic domain-containing protein [Trichonephila clavipes]
MALLSWIKKKEPWNTFVGNRVKEIRDLNNIENWRHVPGEVNPAYLATRCYHWSDLLKSKRSKETFTKVQTRLILNQDPEDFTHPTVLPDHPLLERLILYTHRSLMHAGVLTTLAQLREKFWIPKGRRVVRAILRQCIKCKRLTAGKVNPDPAPLPPDRIHRVAAFQITGADLAGPLSIRGGSKAWIVLFTCAVYRAVHLELVSSLST